MVIQSLCCAQSFLVTGEGWWCVLLNWGSNGLMVVSLCVVGVRWLI